MTKLKKFNRAVEENDIRMVKELLKYVNPAYDDDRAIMVASRNGYVEVVRLLLDDDRVDPTTLHNSPIREASQNGHVEVVRVLLDDDKVNPADVNNDAIRLASKCDHDEIVDMLYYDYRVCHLQLVLDIIKTYEISKPKKLIERLIEDTDLQIFHPENESLHPDKKIYSLDLINELYKADEETKQAFIEKGFNQDLFTFISLLK